MLSTTRQSMRQTNVDTKQAAQVRLPDSDLARRGLAQCSVLLASMLTRNLPETQQLNVHRSLFQRTAIECARVHDSPDLIYIRHVESAGLHLLLHASQGQSAGLWAVGGGVKAAALGHGHGQGHG